MTDPKPLWPDDGEPFTPIEPMPEPAPPLSRQEWMSIVAFVAVVYCCAWIVGVLK